MVRAFFLAIALWLAALPAFAQSTPPGYGPGGVPASASGAPPTGSASGDLGGTYPNPTVVSVAHVNTGTLPVANGGTGQTTASNACAQLSALCVLEATSVSVASTGDAGTITIPAGSYIANNAWLYNCSNGAVGSITATIRTASSGGGTALSTFTAVTPPASGSATAATSVLGTTVATATTLYINISATTATGTCSFPVKVGYIPAS